MIPGLKESDGTPGPKDSADREASHAVMTLCDSGIGLRVSATDISAAYRIPRKGKEKHRPIIIRFISLRVRNLVLVFPYEQEVRKILENLNADPDENYFVSE